MDVAGPLAHRRLDPSGSSRRSRSGWEVISQDDRQNEEHGQEAVNRFFAIPTIFILLDTVLPWKGWFDLGWSGPLLVLAVLLLRRTPVLLLLKPFLRDIRTASEALFMGWFGPIAVAAIYYASLMEHRTGRRLR